MSNASEHRRLVEDLLENLDLTKVAKDYFEESDDHLATEMIIFMRDKCPALYEQFMDEWARANEQILVDWAIAQVPDGPEGKDR